MTSAPNDQEDQAGNPFAGAGEVRALARTMDWSATPLGPVGEWPPALRSAVRFSLESPFPICLWCEPGCVLVYNDAYRIILGTKHPDALGRPGSEVWNEIWEEIGPMFERIRAGGPPVYADDAPFEVRRSGPNEAPASLTQAWFTFALSAIRGEEGELVAFLNVVSETTRRVEAERAREGARAEAERAEARLREVFAQAPAFMAVLRGPQHVFESVNAAYYQLVGRRELIGLPVLEALPELSGQGFENLLSGVLETGVPFVGRELEVHIAREESGEPEERFLDFVYYPITEADGSRSGVVAHGYDVTPYVVARREAQEARREAERANLAKSQFLANMSHEIRTPINAVVGYADLLDAKIGGILSDRQQEYVNRIRASSSHLLGLVNDVLDLSKVEAGEVLVEKEEASAGPVVKAALEMIAPQAEARGITLSNEWDCGPSDQFLGDADRVRQIVLNLLSNALKFTPAGGVVTVRCRRQEEARPGGEVTSRGPWLAIDVEDTGPGIAPEQLDRIFEPFTQAAEKGKERPAGTGLGLTISRGFARLMGGELTARSRVGIGSCFTVWLAAPALEAGRPERIRWAHEAEWPPAEEELAGTAALGEALLHAADRVETELLARLRLDPSMTVAKDLEHGQLADHIAAYLSAAARTLGALGEGDDATLEDSEEIQDVLATRHGRQRRRLGWRRQDLQREYEILHDALDETLRREAPPEIVRDLDGALGVAHHLLDRGLRASLLAFDAADRESVREATD